MPFWRRKPDPAPELKKAEIDAARREAEAALPSGWRLEYSDYEAFSLPGGRLETYGILAMGPADERLLVVGVGEANSYRQLVRHLHGDLPAADAWAPPLDAVTGKPSGARFEMYRESDPDARTALAELQAGLPEGWALFAIDRERYLLRGSQLETFGVAAHNSFGDAALAIALTEADAYRQLLRRVRGELEVSEGWVPVSPPRQPRAAPAR